MIQWVELVVFALLFVVVSVMGFLAAALAARRDARSPRRVGPGRAEVRRLDHLVPHRRRHLHRLHLRGRAGAAVRGRRHRLLRRCPTRSSCTRWSSCRCCGCGRSRGCTATSRRPTSSAAATAARCSALLVAITGIVATMPYIALQLVGLEAVLRTMGINGTGFAGHLPLFIAFVILAVYTYQSGLRAPALIAFVKDILIYIVILVAVIYLPPSSAAGPRSSVRRRTSSRQPSPATGRPQGYPARRRTTSCSTSRSRSARRWRCSSTRTRSPASWPRAGAT